MTFNYFRIFITLLASFAAFFGYICRLNLSLTIAEMVEKSDDVRIVQGVLGQNISAPKLPVDGPLYSLSSFITTEEHAVAWIYKSKIRSKKKRLNKAKNTVRMVDTRKFRKLEANSLAPLSIEINVQDQAKTTTNKSSSSSTGQRDSSSSSTNTANISQPDVIEEPTNEVAIEPDETIDQYLLKWSEQDRNNLLGAFFLGYVLFQIPAARAAEIFGSKSLFLITGFGASVCSLIFPIASKCSDNIIFAYIVRVIMGATQAPLFPAIYVLLCEWLPKDERSKWLPYPSAFSRFGAIIMYLVVPFILRVYGWEAVYYVCGTATLLWSILFLIFGSNSPEQSYWISKQELSFIESHIEPKTNNINSSSVVTKNQQQQQRNNIMTASGFTINEEKGEKKPSISFITMAKNKAILILSLVMFTSEWSNMLLLIKLPDFLKSALKMELEEIGLLSSILVAVYCVQYPLSGYCAFRMEQLNNRFCDSLNVRKIFEAIAQGLQTIGCLMIAFSDDVLVVVSALIIMMIGRGTVGGGQCLMPPELSRDYPGTVFAFANTIANLAGIIGPATVNWLVEDPENYDDWFSIYILSALIFLIAGIIFCIFAENEPQNYCKTRKLKDKSVSKAQLTFGKNDDIEQVFKMEAFSRVSSEPNSEPRLKLGKYESRLI